MAKGLKTVEPRKKYNHLGVYFKRKSPSLGSFPFLKGSWEGLPTLVVFCNNEVLSYDIESPFAQWFSQHFSASHTQL